MSPSAPASLAAAPAGGRFARRWTAYTGLYFDDFQPDSVWLRDSATLQLPALEGVSALILEGRYAAHPEARGLATGSPQLIGAWGSGRPQPLAAPRSPGPWRVPLPLPPRAADERLTLHLHLRGVALTDALAWAGRRTRLPFWQRFRAQHRNRQLRLTRLLTEQGEVIYDFSRRDAPYSPAFARRHLRLGLNIAGFLTAELGIGESARCMVRAADAAGLPTALLDLKLHVKARRQDRTFADRLQEQPAHPVSVFHLDPPAARDLDHHHGPDLRRGRYNIGYFAWELPQFPPAWTSYCTYFDEIWCPSAFVTEAVALRSPVPVLTMPHAVAFPRPTESPHELRARFGLPPDRLLFLFLYDLNSYSPRKNPAAVVEAFRASGLARDGATLVLKTHHTAGNEAALADLRATVGELPGIRVLDETLTRADLYRLEAACDVFVSLHRSEGFGLAVAECMYLGKPVIATDWSATAEYLTRANGCPVSARLVTLEENIGPYAKGQTWAEPDVTVAADWMRRLAADAALRERLGAAARATIESRFAPAVVGRRYRERLETLALL